MKGITKKMNQFFFKSVGFLGVHCLEAPTFGRLYRRLTAVYGIIELIVKTPGSIGIASHVYKSGRTRNPKTPFVSAKVIAITKGSPSEDAQKILDVVKSFDYQELSACDKTLLQLLRAVAAEWSTAESPPKAGFLTTAVGFPRLKANFILFSALNGTDDFRFLHFCCFDASLLGELFDFIQLHVLSFQVKYAV